jgi:hypothetical protein
MARVGRHYGSTEFNPLGGPGGGGKGGNAVQPSAAGGHPSGLNPRIFGVSYCRLDVSNLATSDGHANQLSIHISTSF